MKKRILSLFFLISIMAATILLPTNASAYSGTCGYDANWTLSGGVLTIYGEGEMEDYNLITSQPPWWDCDSNVYSVVIKPGITSIGNNAFSACAYLNSISIPKTVTSIGTSAFEWCDDLRSITLGEGVQTIGISAFENSGVEFITIPKSLKKIEKNAFKSCLTLDMYGKVYYTGTQSQWEDIDIDSGNEILTSKSIEYNTISGTCGDNIRWVLTNGGVLNLTGSGPMYDFVGSDVPWYSSRSKIGEVRMSDGITTIGNNAFSMCDNLASINFGSGLTKIGDLAFSLCPNLRDIDIPSTVTSIGGYAFGNCAALTDITIPNSVTYLGEYAFQYCNGLASVKIGNGLKTISHSTFVSCTSLKTVMLPSTLSQIDMNAFSNCTAIANVYYGGTQAEWSKVTISTGNECLTNATITYDYYPTEDTLGSGTCGSNAKWVVTKDGELIISGYGDMSDYTSSTVPWRFFSIKYATIKSGITSIGNYAFYYSSIDSVSIPNTVTRIGEYAFSNCDNLWSVTIPNSVTTINKWAFASCSALSKVSIPNSVTVIGESAFHYCESLKSIVIPYSVTEIGLRAFAYCKALESVTIPSSVTTIGGAAFIDCTSLQSIVIPNSVTKLGYNAFDGCTSLQNVTLSNSLPYIEDYTFENCSALQSIQIPSSVNEIGYSAFSGCSSLQTVTIPDTVHSLKTAFSNCTSLKSVYIYAEYVYDGAFRDCHNLTDVYIGSKVRHFDCFTTNKSISNITVSPDNKYYKTIDGNLFDYDGDTLYRYIGTKTNSTYIIPDKVEEVASGAFAYSPNLTSIVVPYNVRSLPLDGADNLSNIYYCGTQTEWNHLRKAVPSNAAINYNYGLGASVVAEGDCGSYSFDYGSYTESHYATWFIDSNKRLVIRTYNYSINMDSYNNIEEVPWHAYRSQIKTAEIWGGLNTISDYAFAQCPKLESIYIDTASIYEIGNKAFLNCPSLKEINVKYAEYNREIYSKDGVLYDEHSTLIKYPEGKTDSSFTLGWDTNYVEPYAFAYCKNLKSLVCGRVDLIDDNAFYECKNLEKVYFDSNGLGYLTIGEGNEAFTNAEMLYTKYLFRIIDDTKAEYMGFYAWGDSGIMIPHYLFGYEVVSIADNAFHNTSMDIIIPDTVTSIGADVFSPWASGYKIYYTGSKAQWDKIDIAPSNAVLNSADIEYNYTKELISAQFTDATFDNGVFNITLSFKNAAKDCVAVFKIHNEMTGELVHTFTEFIPKKTTEKVIYLPWEADDKWYGLTAEFVNNTTDNIQYGNQTNSITLYAAVERFMDEESGFEYFVTKDGKAKITEYYGEKGDLIIPETLGGYPVIGLNDWAVCFNPNITSVTIGANITEIGFGALSGCENMTSITVDENNTKFISIDNVIYSKDKTKLILYPAGKTDSSFTVPSTVKTIGNGAIVMNAYLKNITIPEGVEVIEQDALTQNSFESLHIPASVKEIGAYFADSMTLGAITVSPESKYFCAVNGVLYTKDMKVLLEYPGGKPDTFFTIPDGVEKINPRLDSHRHNIKKLSVPSSVKSFTEGTWIDTILYEGSEEEWWQSGFANGNSAQYMVFNYTGQDLVQAQMTHCYYKDGEVFVRLSLKEILAPCEVLLGLYAPDGTLLQIFTATADPYQSNEVTFNIPASEDFKDFHVKALLWNDIGSLKPLGKSITREIN